MKKSLLALAIVTAASSASAVTVYDKDGTSFAVGGRIQAVVYSSNFNKVADHDTGLVNSARLNLGGKTKVNDFVSVFAFTEWNMADGNKAATGDSMNTRDQYVGADFGSFGTVTAGKQFDAFYAVQAATDIYEDLGSVMSGATNGERRQGTFAYTFDNNGFFGKASFETAADDVMVNGDKANVEGGFAYSLGYTLDDVVFGPLSFKAGYSYVAGQDDRDNLGHASMKRFDNFKTEGASISWGSLDSGLYLGALYEQNREKLRTLGSNSSYLTKTNGYELVGGYTFDNGLSAFIGYEVKSSKNEFQFNVAADTEKKMSRRIPVIVNYALTNNFKLWSEAEFDANSSENTNRKNSLSVGARYTF